MTYLRNTIGFLLLFVIGTGVAHAQLESKDEVTNEELNQFVEALKQVQVLEQDAQQEMMGELTNEKMEVERYNEILQSQQNPQMEIAQPTEEELEKISKITQKIQMIQMAAQQKMQAKIEETGLSIERYQQIMSKVQSDPELMQKLQEKMQR